MQNAVKGASRIVLAIVSVALVMGLMPGAAMARQAEEGGSQLQAASVIDIQAQIRGSVDLDDGYFFMFDGRDFGENFYYVDDGGAVTPNVSIYYYSDLADGETEDDEGRTIVPSSKYTITYEKYGEDYNYVPTTAPLGVGAYHVIATANEGSGLIGSTYFYLNVYDKHTLDGAQITFDDSYYDSSKHSYIFPVGGFVEPTVAIDGEVIPTSAYTLHYEDDGTNGELGTIAPTAIGDYYVYATGIEPYEGRTRGIFKFQISEKGAGYYDISDQDVYLTDKVYTGKAIDQVPVVYHPAGLDRLQNGTDFTYKITNNVNAGTAKVAVTGKGHFYGTATGTFKIAKAANPMRAKIASKKTLSAASAKRGAQKVASVSFAKKAVGAVAYKIASAKPIARWFAVSKKGVVSAKKGVRPGKYAVKVQVSAKGDANRGPAKQTLTCAVTVK